jgi:hypothetical protein
MQHIEIIIRLATHCFGMKIVTKMEAVLNFFIRKAIRLPARQQPCVF